MDYRYKDIYTSILPGMLVLGEALYVLNRAGKLAEWGIPKVYLKEMSMGEATLLAFACILVGSIVASIVSVVTKTLQEPSKVPRCLKDKVGIKDEKELWHYVKDFTSPNDKIEEYYVHFAQSRNLMIAFYICSAFSFWFSLKATMMCDCILFCLALIDLAMAFLMLMSYQRHKKRYDQVFLSEFVKAFNKQYPDKAIDLSEIYKDE